MSDIVVTKNEILILIVNQPPFSQAYSELPWRGSLECKAEDWTYDKIVAHAGKAEYIERVLKTGKNGVEDITDAVIEWAEENDIA